MTSQTANDRAWKALIEDHAVIDAVNKHGFVDIDADLIRQYREPRLMCKIDYQEAIPKIFRQNQLSILAIVNKRYRIARTHPFLPIDASKLPQAPSKLFFLPKYLETLSTQSITSEAKALNAACISGMLNEIAGEEVHLTLSGRSYSEPFSFQLIDTFLNAIDYHVNSVQIEVDGGYEGESKLLLIEAKMGDSTNMNLRQLLYPQLNYERLIIKPVVTYFMYYVPGGKFYFLPFSYQGNKAEFLYEKARLFKLRSYQSISFNALFKTHIDNSKTGFGAPFPQADRLDKVVEVFYLINEAIEASKEEVFQGLNFVPRQWDYYINALVWLGLITADKKTKKYTLSAIGKEAMDLPEKERFLFIGKIAFSNELFNAFLYSDNPTISRQLLVANGLNPDATTTPRRLQTVLRWRKCLQWLLQD